MRWAICALWLVACADGAAVDDAGAPDAPPAAAIDGGASPRPDAAVLAPNPLNVHWIGGACAAPGECALGDPLCLRDGFPNGMCTQECTGTCPDRGQPGDTVSTCIDGRPWGFDEGVCVARCDRAQLPGTGCPAGYKCLPKSRYLDATRTFEVCVPEVAYACDGVDELVRIDYPDRGALWIPREAQCGGAFPLVVMLHGINPGMNPTPSLGGGRRLEYETRSLIDGGLMKPVILAEPVQLEGAASSTGLYATTVFEPADHLDLLLPELTRRGITIASLSYTGHSGAGCDANNGLYLVLKRYAALIPAYAPAMKLWGLEDICYAGSYHWTAPTATLAGKGTAIINMWSEQGDPTAFENGLIPQPQSLACASVLYPKCIRHAIEPWCSYRTRSDINHDDNPYFFVREAFPQVFSADGSVRPCR